MPTVLRAILLWPLLLALGVIPGVTPPMALLLAPFAISALVLLETAAVVLHDWLAIRLR